VRLLQRAPGPWTVTIKRITTDPKKPETKVETSHAVELLTVPTFGAALRFGIGASYAAGEREWSTRTTADGTRLVSVRDTVFDPEFIVGIAPFFDRGGRSYFPNQNRVRFAPYFGVAVIGPNRAPAATLPVSFFRSAHLGFEVEFARYTSIALVATARSVPVPHPWLDDGALVGAATKPSDLTHLAPRFGVGIVLNLSPVYFNTLARYAASTKIPTN
jgi:hypothetical protein